MLIAKKHDLHYTGCEVKHNFANMPFFTENNYVMVKKNSLFVPLKQKKTGSPNDLPIAHQL